MAKIALQTMPFFAKVGVADFEKVVGNDFEVSIVVEADILKAAETDDVQYTVDYVDIYAIAKEVMNSQVDLIETLVVRIGSKIMAKYPEMKWCSVRINKISPKVGGPIGMTWVEEEFTR